MIDYDEARALLVRAIHERGPDHVYTVLDADRGDGASCLYFEEDGNPGCIIGHALSYLGIHAYDVADHEGQGVDKVVEDLNLDLSLRARRLWMVAQEMQDNERPWGKCLGMAEQTVKKSTT